MNITGIYENFQWCEDELDLFWYDYQGSLTREQDAVDVQGRAKRKTARDGEVVWSGGRWWYT